MRNRRLPTSFFAGNRKRLLQKMEANSIALISASQELIRNSDVLHPWRQDSTFFYLTGLEKPGCSLLLIPDSGSGPKEILFIPPVDPEREKWEGKMLTHKDAEGISGIKKVQNSETFLTTFYRSQHWKESLYCDVNDVFPDQALSSMHLFLKDILERLPGLSLKKLHLLTTPLRSRKQIEEIDAIKEAINITNGAIRGVAQKIKAGMKEYEVEAELIYYYLKQGCKRVSFEPIVASGKNATILHYTDNCSELQPHDLILIDTGCEVSMYGSDITRVLPISGRFTARQRHCYKAVLEVNQRFIEALAPGKTWNQLAKLSSKITGEVYLKYGLIEDPKKHSDVSLHRIGHCLGLDTHDSSRLDEPLKAGTVITVEPGLYLPDEGIGIRIEDDVLIHQDGIEVLSSSIPKEIDEIEDMMKGK